MALLDLPHHKWGAATGRQVILKGDFARIEQAVVESFDLTGSPEMEYAGPAEVRVAATEDCRARLMLNGFPSPLHRGLWVDGGLADGRYRETAGPAALDLGNQAYRWGEEKPNQWYCIYAVAGTGEILFSLKAMPVMRVGGVDGPVISLRNNANTAGMGYGLATDELAQARLLVLTGASRGKTREIIGNNNDRNTSGTLTYAGDPLVLAPGDWCIVLPATNFRALGMVLNDAGGNLAPFVQGGRCTSFQAARQLASGGFSGYTRVDLGLVVPPTARFLTGYAASTAGSDLKLAISLDGATPHLVLHAPPPGGTLAGVRGALPFRTPVAPGHCLYLNNDDAAGQAVYVTGWEE